MFLDVHSRQVSLIYRSVSPKSKERLKREKDLKKEDDEEDDKKKKEKVGVVFQSL